MGSALLLEGSLLGGRSVGSTPYCMHLLCCLLHQLLFPVLQANWERHCFWGGSRLEELPRFWGWALMRVQSQSKEQGKPLGSPSPYPSPVTSVMRKWVPLPVGGRYGNKWQSFPTAPEGRHIHLIKLTKNVAREENLRISAVAVLSLGLYARCGRHMSDEVVPSSEILQLIKDYMWWQLHFG